jgi:hypothetical protein
MTSCHGITIGTDFFLSNLLTIWNGIINMGGNWRELTLWVHRKLPSGRLCGVSKFPRKLRSTSGDLFMVLSHAMASLPTDMCQYRLNVLFAPSTVRVLGMFSSNVHGSRIFGRLWDSLAKSMRHALRINRVLLSLAHSFSRKLHAPRWFKTWIRRS